MVIWIWNDTSWDQYSGIKQMTSINEMTVDKSLQKFVKLVVIIIVQNVRNVLHDIINKNKN